MQGFSSTADVERFLLVHGEHIVDVLGSEVDRIESNIKVSAQFVLCMNHCMNYMYLPSSPSPSPSLLPPPSCSLSAETCS